jgi:Predicted membrane protein (DUF2142)
LRLTGLIVASAMIAYAIALTPFLKWAFVCVAMLPTAIYQRAVISIDGIVLGATLLVVALCLAAVLAPGDVAPNFYPAAIGVWRSVIPSWAVMAAVRGAEPSVERSAADRRAAA